MKIKVKVFRFNPDTDKNSYFQTFNFPYLKGMTVLDALNYIQEHLDPTLSFRWECRSGICGTCGIMFNKKPVLACKTLIDPGKISVIKPLKNFPVEKDLVVDLTFVLEKLKRVRPYLHKGKGRIKSKEQAEKSKEFRKCIECGCCISASETIAKNHIILDPMAMVKLARFVTDPRDDLNRKKIAQDEGVSYYSKREIKRIAKACPQEIDITRALEILKRK